jgi:hypothetical protein
MPYALAQRFNFDIEFFIIFLASSSVLAIPHVISLELFQTRNIGD